MNKKENTIFVRIPPEIKTQLLEIANAQNRSLSNLVATIIKDFLNKEAGSRSIH